MTLNFLSMTEKFGTVKKIKNLREIWKSESDFTRWIACEENMRILSEAIGAELELVKTEAAAGRYSVDILARELNLERNVVIENQLEDSDHDHLGKLSTYAAGYDAAIIIWIVRKAREEHVKAIEWLNEHSDDTIGFFLLEIDVLRVDDSRPAVQFKIIAKPNEWAKTVRAYGNSKDLSDTKQRQLNFWTDFKRYAEIRNLSLSCQTPKAQYWYCFAIGSSIARLRIMLNTQKSRLVCELYIPKNKNLFNFLKSKKSVIEAKLGVCDWISSNVGSRIAVRKYLDDVMPDEETSRNEEFKWFFSQLELFGKVFAPLVKDFSAKERVL